ncbi:conserved hypothetical protein [Uncinocarpus reesii 1704]|uniref:RGS domain-containing protein n=1 Tax=Uncinocarpus reesii (strain UAMH 1704) TaxID=336963 RepID=C4JQ78_UNCRE|nr:uncharacterized protein UREG_03311 [Uncinocarpus reesii 1704]EEP78465.1 conserved hypothetical protein [Uncinocarpus reesii 1704]
MRDREHAVDYLDFWIDVAQHETLCRQYAQDLLRRDPPEGPLAEGDNGNASNDSESRRFFAKSDLQNSAMKLLYTYLLRGSERHIALPPSITDEVSKAIEQEGRDDPGVFAQAKEYVLQAMERDSYPRFLQHQALGNIVLANIKIRMTVGLLSTLGGFWASFMLAILGYSRPVRCWVRPPIPTAF